MSTDVEMTEASKETTVPAAKTDSPQDVQALVYGGVLNFSGFFLFIVVPRRICVSGRSTKNANLLIFDRTLRRLAKARRQDQDYSRDQGASPSPASSSSHFCQPQKEIDPSHS
jgi:hypothetical protein